jgi:hypothetical protein
MIAPGCSVRNEISYRDGKGVLPAPLAGRGWGEGTFRALTASEFAVAPSHPDLLPARGEKEKSPPRSYFLTQITRTAAALASSDPPDGLTPLALRKSCTASGDTSTACAAA